MAKTKCGILMNEGCEDLFPKKNHPSDTCFDVFAAEEVTLAYNEVELISLGFKVQLEPGWGIQLRPRSGNALKIGITFANSVGTIDSEYIGNVGAIVKYTGTSEVSVCKHIFRDSVDNIEDIDCDLICPEPITIKRGDKIGQICFEQVHDVELVKIDSIEKTNRGEKGFGSSGLAGTWF